MAVTILRLPGAGWHKRRPPFVTGGGKRTTKPIMFIQKTGTGDSGHNLGHILRRDRYAEAAEMKQGTLSLGKWYGVINFQIGQYPSLDSFLFADADKTILRDNLAGERWPKLPNEFPRVWTNTPAWNLTSILANNPSYPKTDYLYYGYPGRYAGFNYENIRFIMVQLLPSPDDDPHLVVGWYANGVVRQENNVPSGDDEALFTAFPDLPIGNRSGWFPR